MNVLQMEGSFHLVNWMFVCEGSANEVTKIMGLA